MVWHRWNFVKMFDAGKTRMIGLPYGEKLWRYVKPFSSDTGTLRTDRRTDRQTDRQTDRFAIPRVSMLTRDKNFRSYITVKAHCSMTHLKQQRSLGVLYPHKSVVHLKIAHSNKLYVQQRKTTHEWASISYCVGAFDDCCRIHSGQIQ